MPKDLRTLLREFIAEKNKQITFRSNSFINVEGRILKSSERFNKKQIHLAQQLLKTLGEKDGPPIRAVGCFQNLPFSETYGDYYIIVKQVRKIYHVLSYDHVSQIAHFTPDYNIADLFEQEQDAVSTLDHIEKTAASRIFHVQVKKLMHIVYHVERNFPDIKLNTLWMPMSTVKETGMFTNKSKAQEFFNKIKESFQERLRGSLQHVNKTKFQ
jgi:hypothetical protein